MLILLMMTKDKFYDENENLEHEVSAQDIFINSFMHVKETWNYIRDSILTKYIEEGDYNLDLYPASSLYPVGEGYEYGSDFAERNGLFAITNHTDDHSSLALYYLMEKDNEEPESEPKLMDDDSERVGYLKYRLMKYKESR